MNSPPFSFAGYSFKTWLRRNVGNLKLVVSAVGAYALAQAGLIADPALNGLACAVAGVAVKLGLDALDYWLSDVPQDHA